MDGLLNNNSGTLRGNYHRGSLYYNLLYGLLLDYRGGNYLLLLLGVYSLRGLLLLYDYLFGGLLLLYNYILNLLLGLSEDILRLLLLLGFSELRVDFFFLDFLFGFVFIEDFFYFWGELVLFYRGVGGRLSGVFLYRSLGMFNGFLDLNFFLL